MFTYDILKLLLLVLQEPSSGQRPRTREPMLQQSITKKSSLKLRLGRGGSSRLRREDFEKTRETVRSDVCRKCR